MHRCMQVQAVAASARVFSVLLVCLGSFRCRERVVVHPVGLQHFGMAGARL